MAAAAGLVFAEAAVLAVMLAEAGGLGASFDAAVPAEEETEAVLGLIVPVTAGETPDFAVDGCGCCWG